MEIVKVTTNSLVSTFIKNYQSQATRTAYSKDLFDFFKHFENRFSHPKEISIASFVEYRDSLKDKGLASATINRKISSVKALMDWCVVYGVISVNPAASLKLPSVVTESPTSAFTDEEVSKLLSLPDGQTFHGSVHRLALSLLFYLGLRRSELVNIRMKDFYEDRGVKALKITGKGGKLRVLPICEELEKELKLYADKYLQFTGKDLHAQDFLIQSEASYKNEKPMNTSSIFKMLDKYAKQAGIIKRVSPHSCRATVISHLLEKQLSPRDVADFAGHSNINTTVGIYDKKRLGLANHAAHKVSFSK